MERGAYQGEPFIIEQNIRVYKIIQNLLLAHQGPLYNILALFGCFFFFPLHRSLPGKRPWALLLKSRFSNQWALTRCIGRLPCV